MSDGIDRSAPADRVSGGTYAIAWVVLALVMGLAFVGAYQGWADRWVWWDEAIHICSFFAITLVVGLYLYGESLLLGPRRHALRLIFTLLCVAVTLGVAWEWGELAYDRVTGKESVIKGKFDTLLDLVMDGIGGVLAGAVMLALVRRRRCGPATA